jgi:fatty-acyl-CoA synthase
MSDFPTMQGLVLALADNDAVGLIGPSGRHTHREVVAEAAKRAAWLQANRVDGPFHVGTLLDVCEDYVYLLDGAALVGAAVVGGNSTHRGSDLARDLAHADCQLLVTCESLFSLLDGLHVGEVIGTVTRDNPRVVICDSDAGRATFAAFKGTVAQEIADPSVDPMTLAALIFTSGTSGAPKAVKCSQGRLAFIGTIMGQMFGLTGEDVFYESMPLFHSNAMMACYSPCRGVGGALALPTGGKFSASGFIEDVRNSGATFFNYVGKPLAFILATPPSPRDKEHQLKLGFGNESSAEDRLAFMERFGCTIVDGYGSTEGGLSVTRTPDTPERALGVAPEGTVVLNEDGNECPRAIFDAEGKLLNAEEATGALVSGPSANFEGYYKNPEADAARMKEGRFHTGDLAYRDEAGFFYFAGRDFDWLRVDGENFASAPVEGILARHHDIMLAAVYAVPDLVIGDAVMAAVQLRPGANFDGVLFDQFLSEQSDLGTKWAPTYIRICDELPITATTKVLKQTLRSDALATTDEVYSRSARSGPYILMSDADKVDLMKRLFKN